jgi:hypothetical protein
MICCSQKCFFMGLAGAENPQMSGGDFFSVLFGWPISYMDALGDARTGSMQFATIYPAS